MSLYFEDWGAVYGSPYLIDEDAAGEDAVLAEPEEPFARMSAADPVRELAFVDGVRRIEGLVYHRDAAGVLARGVVGAHASGAVVMSGRPVFHRLRCRRMVVLGGGRNEGLARVGGYEWEQHSVGSSDPEAPLLNLHQRMRQAEAALAESLASEGWLTIVDGPLNVREFDQPVVGFVKTHIRRRLAPELHARVPELATAQRTPLFLARESYSAYVRIAPATPFGNPWGGIVRIEVPESQGLARAQQRADQVAVTLPRFAGVAHKDPRAPQNLLPIGALERQLRHRLGPADRAARAVRLSVANPRSS